MSNCNIDHQSNNFVTRKPKKIEARVGSVYRPNI